MGANRTEKRRRYDKEFKISAVKMILEEGMNTAQVSRDLGVNENSLYKWKREYVSDQQNAFPGKGRMKPEEEELRELRKQVKRLEMERDILEKAIGYFTKVQE
ncbi:MAG TPA: transposase [Ignavibacteriaceae bacterium]|nr:transposase [Ignavibacteriaceae bacterium]